MPGGSADMHSDSRRSNSRGRGEEKQKGKGKGKDETSDGESEEFFVETITAARVRDPTEDDASEWEYKVRWLGYGSEEDTWQTDLNLHNCSKLLESFWAQWGGDPDFSLGQEIRPDEDWIEISKRRSRREAARVSKDGDKSKKKTSERRLASFRMQRLPVSGGKHNPEKSSAISTSHRASSPVSKSLISIVSQLEFQAPGKENILPSLGSKRKSRYRDSSVPARVDVDTSLSSDSSSSLGKDRPVKRRRLRSRKADKQNKNVTSANIEYRKSVKPSVGHEDVAANTGAELEPEPLFPDSPKSNDSLFSGPTPPASPSPPPVPGVDPQGTRPTSIEFPLLPSHLPGANATSTSTNVHEQNTTPLTTGGDQTKFPEPSSRIISAHIGATRSVLSEKPVYTSSSSCYSTTSSRTPTSTHHPRPLLKLLQPRTNSSGQQSSTTPTLSLPANGPIPTKAAIASRVNYQPQMLGRQSTTKNQSTSSLLQPPSLSNNSTNSSYVMAVSSNHEITDTDTASPTEREVEKFLNALNLDVAHPPAQMIQAHRTIDPRKQGFIQRGTVPVKESRDRVIMATTAVSKPTVQRYLRSLRWHQECTLYIGQNSGLHVQLSDESTPLHPERNNLSTNLRLQTSFKFRDAISSHFLESLLLQNVIVNQFARVTIDDETQAETFGILNAWLARNSTISRAKFEIDNGVPGAPGSLLLMSPVTANKFKRLSVPRELVGPENSAHMIVALLLPRVKPSMLSRNAPPSLGLGLVESTTLEDVIGNCTGKKASVTNSRIKETVHTAALKKVLAEKGTQMDRLYKGKPHFMFVQVGTPPEKIPGLAYRRFCYPELRFITFGRSSFSNRAACREIWRLGGLVTFTPRALWDTPFQVQSKLKIISQRPFYDVYISPACFGYICSRFKFAGKVIDSDSRFLLQQMVIRLVTKGVITLAECPPQEWEGEYVKQWQKRMLKLDRLCTLAAICSLGDLDLCEPTIGSLPRQNRRGPVQELIDFCVKRCEELRLEDDDDVYDYIQEDIAKFQVHPMGLNNYRRYVVIVGEGKAKNLAEIKTGVELQVASHFEFVRDELNRRGRLK